MTRGVLLLVILTGSLSLCLAQQNKSSQGPPAPAGEYSPQTWKPLSSAEGGFTVQMPGVPISSNQPIKTNSGEITQYLYQLNTGTGFYLISYFEVPAYSDDPQAIKSAIDAGRDNMLANNQRMKLLSEREIKIDGRDGREMLVDDDNSIMIMRAVFANKRAYQIVFGAAYNTVFKKGVPSADPDERTDLYKLIATRFFDSFKLLPGSGAFILGSGGSETPAEEGEVDRMLREERDHTVIGAAAEDSEGKSSFRKGVVVSGGILNARATVKPAPAYPKLAKSARVTGTVVVRILVGEEGNVIAAQAESGHPLLRAASVTAAREARFDPILLDGKPVKVSGTITYNFSLR